MGDPTAPRLAVADADAEALMQALLRRVRRAEYERDDARRNEQRANGRLQTMREEVAHLRLALASAPRQEDVEMSSEPDGWPEEGPGMGVCDVSAALHHNGLHGAEPRGMCPGFRVMVLAQGGIVRGPRPFLLSEDGGWGDRCFPSTADAMVLDDMGVGRPARVTDYTGTGRPMSPPKPNPSVESQGQPVWGLLLAYAVVIGLLVLLALTS